MEYASLVLHPDDPVHGWGRIRDDADGSWFEPDHAIALGRGADDRRWPDAVRLYNHDPTGVAVGFDTGSIPNWATITGIWRGDSILASSTSPIPWRSLLDDHHRPQSPRHPTTSPELTAARDSLAPHRQAWAVAFSNLWIDPDNRPHFLLGVLRVTPGLAGWASSHLAVKVHFKASLLPADIDPVAAEDWA